MNLTPQEYADKLFSQYDTDYNTTQETAHLALIDVQNTIDALELCAESLNTEDLDNAILYYLTVKSILEGYLNGG